MNPPFRDDPLLVLAPYFQVWPANRTGYAGIGSHQTYIDEPGRWHAILQAAAWWKAPRRRSEAAACFDSPEGREALAFLDGIHALIPPEVAQDGGRYARHLLYYSGYTADPAGAQRRVGQSHVVLFGCGGIGNFIGLILAGAGVGRLTLVDADRVELSNLTRQIAFTEGDVGRLKTEVLDEALRARNADIRIETLLLEVKMREDLQRLPRADLLVLSADHPSALTGWVNAHCVDRAQPYVQIGYAGDIGAYGPFYLPDASGCAACGGLTGFRAPSDEEGRWIREIHTGIRAPSCGPVNALISGYAAADILRFLGGYAPPVALNRRVGIWTTEPRFQFIDCVRSADCAVCGTARRRPFQAVRLPTHEGV